ncbi:hypothetical protein YC2023_094223 [Brassica napus]
MTTATTKMTTATTTESTATAIPRFSFIDKNIPSSQLSTIKSLPYKWHLRPHGFQNHLSFPLNIYTRTSERDGDVPDIVFQIKARRLQLNRCHTPFPMRLTTLSRDNFFHTYVDVVGNIKLSNGHQQRPITDSREHGQGPVEGYRGTRLLKIAVGNLTEVYKFISSYQSYFQSNIMLCIGSRFTVDQDGAGVT